MLMRQLSFFGVLRDFKHINLDHDKPVEIAFFVDYIFQKLDLNNGVLERLTFLIG